MNFGSALQHLRIGARIRRRKWAGMFLYLVAASEFEVNRAPLLGIFPQGTLVKYRAHIDYRAFDGSVGVYSFDQEDVLADDWEFDGDFGDSDDINVIDDPAAQHDFDHGGSGLGGHPHDDNEADLVGRDLGRAERFQPRPEFGPGHPAYVPSIDG